MKTNKRKGVLQMDEPNVWNKNWVAWKEDFKPSPFAEKAFRMMKIKDFHDVLDLGCGKGRNSLFFASNGMNVTAMDISDEALKTVEGLRHPKIKTVCADISKADLKPESFDAVFACLSLHYFGDAVTRMIVEKVYRSLRAGGLFFIRCKSVKDKAYGIGEKVGEDMYFDEWIRHFFTPEYMTDVLSGFETAAVCETEEDYFGLCCFVDGIAVKAET